MPSLKTIIFLLVFVIYQVKATPLMAQQEPKPLPLKTFWVMVDSTTSMDIVFLKGKGGSISVEGNNVRLFNTFFENKTVPKTSTEVAGTIMWEINGKEFISGKYFLGDTTGYVVFEKNGKEYVNEMNKQGNSFLKSQIKN